MLAPAHIQAAIRWLPFTRCPDLPGILAALREELNTATAPIAFYPINGGWHIDGEDYRGRLPKGLGLAYAAIRAAQVHSDPPTVTNAHAARKAILSDAVRWSVKHCLPLVDVLRCISVERGEVLFDAGRPGVPKVECGAD